MGRRTWIKIYTDKWLRGTLRNESPTTRGIFADIIALAGDSAYGDDGVIKLSSQVALTDDQIAAILNIIIDEWRKTKERLKITGRISVDSNNIITVTNWKKYQSEYRRQRQNKLKSRQSHSEMKESLHGLSSEHGEAEEKSQDSAKSSVIGEHNVED
ncbi:MAG: phage replisome organizer N-terminal domain-containing protein [Promethearchaeota archaeon]